jgi:hypothetical protein
MPPMMQQPMLPTALMGRVVAMAGTEETETRRAAAAYRT